MRLSTSSLCLSLALAVATTPVASAGKRPGATSVAPMFPDDDRVVVPLVDFTGQCKDWGIEYEGRYLYLWFSCQDTTATDMVNVRSRMPLDKALFANAKEIVVRTRRPHPSLSSLCKDCRLGTGPSTTAILSCTCSTNGGSPRLSIVLNNSITSTPWYMPCFHDGEVCATLWPGPAHGCTSHEL